MAPEIVLVIGGCRSGKSRIALDRAMRTSAGPRLYIATMVPLDAELKSRVKRHRQERDATWQTIETPLNLPENITAHCRAKDIAGQVVLVDCLTLWLNNLLMENLDDTAILQRIDALCQALNTTVCPVILVSNEVGAGIVPESPLARRFRDLAGLMNQKVAATAHEVIWTVAGIPVTVKGQGAGA